MGLKDLEIYKIARSISKYAWKIYVNFDWNNRKIMGDQWIASIDSIGANIAEGFGRFHYLDKNKFNYNARGSLLEAIHWTELLEERKKLNTDEIAFFASKFEELHPKINNYIKSTKDQVGK